MDLGAMVQGSFEEWWSVAGRPLKVFWFQWFVAFFVGLVGAPCVTLAEPRPAETAKRSFESERFFRAVAQAGLTVEAAPEGKIVTKIIVDRHDVFEAGEFWPDFFVLFNGLHGLTEEAVILREMTFQVGDAYSDRALEETMRNLRALGIFSLVRMEAVQTGRDGEVAIFVYTRDLWSLRLETAFAGAGPAFQVQGALTERNLLGKNKLASLRMAYRPITMSMGQSYRDYRVLGERFELKEDGLLYYNHDRGRFEGALAALRFGRPFYRLDQSHGFDLYVGYRGWVHRDLRGAQAATVDLQDGELAPCAVTDPSCARVVYGERTLQALAAAHMRFGGRFKHTFTLGGGFAQNRVAAREESAVGEGYEADFASAVLPLQRRTVYPYVRYQFFSTDYAKFQNLGSYGLTETVRQGPSVDTTLKTPLSLLGSTYDAARLDVELGYLWADYGALIEFKAGAGGRLEQNELRDQSTELMLRGATPPWLAGRLAFRGIWKRRKNDTARTYVALGADNGLRGYPLGAVSGFGASYLLLNTEYRTLPLNLSSIHVGGVLFWDAGAVYGGQRAFALRQAVGVGLRVLLPQVNVYPFRLDVGTPLDSSGFSVLLSYGSQNAVPLTANEDTLLEATAF